MDDQGRALENVIAALQRTRRRDSSYAEGEILGSMCTAPDPAALEAFRIFYETNLGDPGHFPGARALETEYLDMLLELTHANDGAKGLFTSGGTESNVVAVYAAREAWRRRTHNPRGRPNIVVPQAAHFSFEKAARLTDVELRYADTDAAQRVDPDSVARLVDEDTALIVAIAGTTEVGVLDDVAALAEIGHARDVPVHVDAALGGFILPFLPGAGRDPVPWDFTLPGVTTITMDPHKMGASLIPGGILLARTAAWLDDNAVETPYVTTKAQAGILGTRPGAGAAAAWAAAKHLGRNGYIEIVRRCMDAADRFRAALDDAAIPYRTGDLNVILVHADDPDALQAALDAKGWRVNAVPNLSGIRVVVMPHVHWHHLERFLPDLIDAWRAAHPGKATKEACA